MKINRIYFKETIINLGHKTHADSSVHKIEQVAQGFLIDNKVLVPLSNCREILVSADDVEEPIKPVNVLPKKVK